MSQFAHLHLHTQYSLLDGVNKISEVVAMAAKLGQPAIAMTDHGNMHGALQFYEAAKSAGIKPILGCELYINPVSRFERKSKAQGGSGTHHLTVMAKDQEGYVNLCRLVTLAYRDGFYFKPRIDHEILKEYSKGLIVLSGCLASEVSELVRTEAEKELKSRIEMYAGIFGEDYYLEVQPHIIPEQRKLNSVLAEYAKSIGVPMVATTDCHYLTESDHFAQEVLMCISTGKQVTDPERIKHEGVKLHLKTAEEMLAEFAGESYASEAIANTLVIADKTKLAFDFSTYHMPQFEAEPSKTLDEMMAERARQGLSARKDKLDPNIPAKDYNERLESEIAMLASMGFSGYFLVVSDFINWAKSHDIPVGPGRGSAAGSLVAYCLKITEVDPIKHKLLFERFLNPERVSLPDIDVDFCIYGRDEVIKYVVDKYGEDKVAQIATFGTLKAKAAIKDVGRALGLSYAETDRVAQLVPAPRQGFDFSLTESMKMEPRLAEYAKAEGKELIDLALRLEGLTRHASTHAAGVVIGDRPLVDMLPMMIDKDGNYVTQFSMKYVEKIGLVKFDFLGLKTLTVIRTACDLIEKSQGIKLDPNDFPIEDPRTYQLLCEGNTTGVFQLESSGITDVTMKLKPSGFNDLVAILALYRPGPLDAGMVDHYINRKHGREEVVYLHPAMEPVLKDTYGIIVYQEQIMKLAQDLAGYSLGDADLLRRAMGKKVPAEMAAQRERFVSGSIKNNIQQKHAEEIFDQMETFARYGFNRSHSAAYGMISFQTAYLRAHYPVEFMAGLMTHETDDSDKVLKNLNECRRRKITVLPPDINRSALNFSVEDGKIRYGFLAVKGVGEKSVLNLVEQREKDGDFLEFEDFIERIDLKLSNRRVLENLIKCGACDTFKLSRREMLERLENAIKYAQARNTAVDVNQITLFGAISTKIPRKNTNAVEYPVNVKLSMEREALGFYISGHPVAKYESALKRMGAHQIASLADYNSTESLKLGGVVTALKLKNTKKGDRYASFVLEDWTGTIEAIVWPRSYNIVANILAREEPILCTGKINATEERKTYIIEQVESLLELRDRTATQGILLFREDDTIDKQLDELLNICQQYPGTCPLKVKININGEEVSLILKDRKESPVCVYPSEELCDRVEQIFRRPVLSFV